MQPNKSLKQLKDQIFSVATIKIEKLRECYKGRGCYHFKDKFWLVDVKKGGMKISLAFENRKIKKMWNWIRHEVGK